MILSVGPLLGITDAFVITSGANDRQVRTVVEEVERQLKEGDGLRPRCVEGLDDAHWVLMDYGDFVVHVFLDQVRDFYQLERLWADAEMWSFDDEEPSAAAARS